MRKVLVLVVVLSFVCGLLAQEQGLWTVSGSARFRSSATTTAAVPTTEIGSVSSNRMMQGQSRIAQASKTSFSVNHTSVQVPNGQSTVAVRRVGHDPTEEPPDTTVPVGDCLPLMLLGLMYLFYRKSKPRYISLGTYGHKHR